MQPQYIRFVVPSNNNLQLSSSSQGSSNFKNLQQVLNGQGNMCSIRILSQTVPSPTAILPTRFIIKTASTNIPNQVSPQIINKVTVDTSSIEKQTISSSTDESVTDSNVIESPLPAKEYNRNATTANMKSAPLNTKKTFKKLKDSPEDCKSVKRSKNWSEGETLAFINVWKDFYSQLHAVGQRNAPVYSMMAKELKSILKDRDLKGGDVKNKISNLTIEYRRKKKEQGKTGASPCKWPFFDVLDKLLGERPYNDDSLLSDSLVLEEGEPMEDEKQKTVDLNATQESEPVSDTTTASNVEEAVQLQDAIETQSTKPFLDNLAVKSDSPRTNNSMAKNNPSKKKRPFEIKMDMMRQLLGEIKEVGAAARQTQKELKEILTEQTKIQREAMDNDKELLSIFRDALKNR